MSAKSVTVKIDEVLAREVLDSRGMPTVEVDLQWGGGRVARAIVPSGASTGEHEALELRDGDKERFLGKGVLKAVENVKTRIAPAIVGKDFADQRLFDDLLLNLDGTENKSKLGANAVLAVSMAFARARADAAGLPLWRSIAQAVGGPGVTLPVPLMNILNGGKHADNGLDIQEFMVVPLKFDSFREALRAGAEVFHHLKKILHAQGLSTGVGDEGGFAPVIPGGSPGSKTGIHERALQLLVEAIGAAGYKAGKDMALALDCASSEFCKKAESGFVYTFEGEPRTAKDMVRRYEAWTKTYPIVSIEDGMGENDWDGWSDATSVLGSRIQLVGDDLFVTNPKFLRRGIDGKTANSILIKLNQIGTVTETLDTIRMAREAGYTAISSHRSGESEDTFIADMAVGTDCGQIKTGSACRTDRTAKYNQLLRIEEAIMAAGGRPRYAGGAVFAGR